MLYLSQMLGKPVLDSDGEEIGRISDLAIQTGEVFPRITSLAFLGPSKTPFMVSWRKYVASFEGGRIALNKPAVDIRFSYLQPDEILLARDLLNKQIVDTQGLKVVRVNDLKFSSSGPQLRLLGAEVGARGILRGFAPVAERAALAVTKLFGHPLEEQVIAWNYMELVDRDLSSVKLAMSHKRLSELHPADVADILEQLNPHQRALVFDHLDKQQAAETFSELEDEYQADMIDDLSENEAADLLANMDPDDAADILGDLPYEKKEKLLWLMGVSDQRRIRALLGYRDKTAGGIMTPEFVALPEETTVGATIEKLRRLDDDHETVHYVYTLDADGRLSGALSLRVLVLADNETALYDLVTRDLITADPEDDQEDVADAISKYDLLAMPVVDESRKLLGIVTVDDAMDVLEEEHSEDLAIAGAGSIGAGRGGRGTRSGDETASVGTLARWLVRRELWFIVWAIVAVLTIFAGGFARLGGALLLAPFVLILAENAVALALGDLLDYEGSRKPGEIAHVFGRNLLFAVVVTEIVGLFFWALSSALASANATLSIWPDSWDGEQARLYGHYALQGAFAPTLIASFVLLALSFLVNLYGRRRLSRDKTLSNTGITLAAMLFALLIQLSLAWLLTPWIVA
ncbi:MAG: CBS domain-containing protein [Coriobacteriales bacterium]|jgi:CBS domain-containing protein/sporulation protein YlmC with PRC-barrel domain|nr:CBS domain-containing protein [Coriobacteriales bacterium]